MLSTALPIVLALVGTVLMAIVIFAPAAATAVAPVPAAVAVSYAPPLEPSAAFDRFDAFDALEHFEPAPPAEAASYDSGWPALVDPRAATCDAAARLALVDALATVRTPWAGTILRHALAGEADAAVRAAIAAAMAL
jgi:hypothetical protein